MRVSNEEFFMYLTIAIIVLAPLTARIYRKMTMKRTTEMLREQFAHPSSADSPPTPDPKLDDH
ncbi:MAG: hypothetical protein U0172_05900 [Nitrospiraceae bacterium]